MATLLSMAQRAIRRIPGFAVPDSIVSNIEDDVAQRLWECANTVGEELVADYDWQELLVEDYTFATVNGTAQYDLPSDYERWVNQTTWDRTNQWPLRGPMTGMEYQTLKSGVVTAGVRYWFRVGGGSIIVYPTPTEVATLVFDYYKNAFCQSSGGSDQTEWLSDSDVPLLDTRLFIIGTRYYFKRSQGLPYEDDETDYYNLIGSLKYNNTPKPVIDMAGNRLVGEHPNMPDTGYGA